MRKIGFMYNQSQRRGYKVSEFSSGLSVGQKSPVASTFFGRRESVFSRAVPSGGAFYWLGALAAISFCLPQRPNVNPAARIAPLAAFVEDQTFQIDRYVTRPPIWTEDWARSPNRHYYSNKAPLPIWLGVPLYEGLDRSLVRDPTRVQRDLHRFRLLMVSNYILAVFVQLIPFLFAASCALRWLTRQGISTAGHHYAAMALCFGNTLAIFTNLYFGHCLAATFVLLAFLALAEEKPLQLGLWLGASVLCDYSCIALLPPFLIGVGMKNKKGLGVWLKLAIGLAILAPFGLTYNSICFGSPFALSYAYQNPRFVDNVVVTRELWGILRLAPSPEVLAQLLIGPSRGILLTQPWVLWMCVLVVSRWTNASENQRPLLVTAILSFVALLWLNACFGGWHGGESSGPRYLSPIFPLLAIISGCFVETPSRDPVAWASLFFSIIMTGSILAVSPYGPVGEPLYHFLVHAARPISAARFVFYSGVLLLTASANGFTPRRARELS